MAGAGGGSTGKCCCTSLFGLVFTAGFIVLIYWAIFQPHHIRATVESATLANLTVVSNSNASSAAVSYHLSVTLSLYNPSVRVNIYYDAIGPELRFRGAVVGPAANATSPPAFYQRRKTSDDVRLDFDYGVTPGGVAVGADVAAELEKEMRSGGPVSLELAVDVHQVRVQDVQAAAEAEGVVHAEHSGEDGGPPPRLRRRRRRRRRPVQG